MNSSLRNQPLAVRVVVEVIAYSVGLAIFVVVGHLLGVLG